MAKTPTAPTVQENLVCFRRLRGLHKTHLQIATFFTYNELVAMIDYTLPKTSKQKRAKRKKN